MSVFLNVRPRINIRDRQEKKYEVGSGKFGNWHAVYSQCIHPDEQKCSVTVLYQSPNRENKFLEGPCAASHYSLVKDLNTDKRREQQPNLDPFSLEELLFI